MTRVVSITVAFTLLLLTLLLFPPIASAGDLGLCLLSPNQWGLPCFLGWFLNTILIVMAALVVNNANKKYNFIQEADPVAALALLLLMGCSYVSTFTLTTSTILLFANAVALFIILSTYEEQNVAREFFLLGTIPAIGAMFQYAFIVMIPVYLGGGLIMKSLRLRELLAFLFGLIAPFWIVVGLGIVSPEAFRLPETLTPFSTAQVNNDIFLTLIAAGLLALTGVILAFYNGVRLFSRNSQLRSTHLTFNIMGFVAIIAMAVDFHNFTAYFGTLALWVALETAALLSLYNVRSPRVALGILLLIFLPIYILAL